MIRNRNVAPDAGIDISKIVGFGCGEVFHVAQGNTSQHEWLSKRVDASHLFTSIQKALDACVSERNDYVLVWPDGDDYDLTAALTMSKRNVHLIGVGGVTNMKYGCPNSVRIHQTTALTQVITVTAQCVEIAGLFIKGADDTKVISTSTHTLRVHHCMIGMGTTAGAADAYGIYAGSGECVHLDISNNLITNYNPVGTSKTLGAAIYIANGTRSIVQDNLICTGSGTTTFTVGIYVGGMPCFVLGNRLVEAVNGVFTKGITVAAGSSVMGNMFSMTTASDAISGGTANETVCNNYASGAAGGALVVV